MDLSTAKNSTVEQILHFLQIILPQGTLLRIDNSANDNINQLIDKPICLFTRNSSSLQPLIERLDSINLSIYTIEDELSLVDEKTHYSNIDDLVGKLVELIVQKYRQQAEAHTTVGKNQLADIEIRMIHRIEFEVEKFREL
ncbi:unnamed protein product [Rotaria sp. Silwood2]|nr:unnamed protein product [Rotaria sp. Silwood2]CAF2848282.1 unnamed protein product [Rotaria sp. Silwood2]CAF3165180.1 unnamed protein product [Rotaria sp. Silwood2]CAF4066750.1 unnamed protein product [Rotaria sp. Silwood2]CAF4279256.1 unnamed protein product [Rotaria sp. Silwood2]